MKNTIRWIILIWSILSVPYTLEAETFAEFFFQLLFVGLIIWLMISDIKGREKKK